MERLGGVGKKVSGQKLGKNKMLSKRQEIFKNAIEGKLRVQEQSK